MASLVYIVVNCFANALIFSNFKSNLKRSRKRPSNLKVTSINWYSFQQAGTDWDISIKENTQEFREILGCLTEILNIS